jgi:uncharacterized protein (TIGR02646 family)
MIHLERGPAPSILNSADVKSRLKSAAKYFSVPIKQRLQQRYNFFPAIRFEGVRDALAKAFHNKCAYCESPVETTTGYEIDSFRPRNRSVNLNGELAPDHYWWLTYEWPNMLLSCSACNKLKGSRFPIEGARAAIGTTDQDKLREELPLLLDPCFDYPEVELLFDQSGKVASDTKRGRVTIDVLSLNRTSLVELRAEELKLLSREWSTVLKEKGVAHLTSPARPFLAMRRQFVYQWSNERVNRNPKLRSIFESALSFRTALTPKTQAVATRSTKLTRAPGEKRASRKKSARQAKPSAKHFESVLKSTAQAYASYEAQTESFSVTREKDKESYFTKTRLIERIEIKNFKIIKNLALPVLAETSGKGSWLVLLGENGTGKSSILQAVALTLMGKNHRSKLKLKASNFVRYGEESGYVKVYLTGTTGPVELHFRKGSNLFTAKPEDPKCLLLGYGATRLLPRNGAAKASSSALDKVEAAKAYNLFNPFMPLNDATPWLWNLKDDEFDRIARSLKDLMLLNPKDRLIRNPKNKKSIEVKAFGTLGTLEDLSDGYQSTVALTTDIMSVMRLRWGAMEIAEGIVLIDEIDAHLHPSWKMKIIKRLRAVFPRLQFLVTSHDPLTLRGLHAGEVAVMRADNKHHPVAVTDLPSPEGMRVDQLLTSEYFGLNSTVDPEVDEKFEQYYQLLALRKRTKTQKEMLANLKIEMDKLEVLGSTRRERFMLEATDEYLAQASQRTTPDLKLKGAALKKVRDMWKKLV